MRQLLNEFSSASVPEAKKVIANLSSLFVVSTCSAELELGHLDVPLFVGVTLLFLLSPPGRKLGGNTSTKATDYHELLVEGNETGRRNCMLKIERSTT